MSNEHEDETGKARLDLSLGEAIYSLRAIRRHRPEPIPDADVRVMLDAAIQAPTAATCSRGTS